MNASNPTIRRESLIPSNRSQGPMAGFEPATSFDLFWPVELHRPTAMTGKASVKPLLWGGVYQSICGRYSIGVPL